MEVTNTVKRAGSLQTFPHLFRNSVLKASFRGSTGG